MQLPQTQLFEEFIFVMFMLEVRETTYRSFWSGAVLWILHYIALFQSVYAHYFSFSSLQTLCTVIWGVHHGGSHFLCLIWNGWIAYPVLISSPSRTLILPVECTLGGCTRSVVQRWLQKSHFHPVDSCLPWENRIRSKWEMFSVAQQWHTAVWLYTPINIHFHAN